jgi:hypothetical protein
VRSARQPENTRSTARSESVRPGSRKTPLRLPESILPTPTTTTAPTSGDASQFALKSSRAIAKTPPPWEAGVKTGLQEKRTLCRFSGLVGLTVKDQVSALKCRPHLPGAIGRSMNCHVRARLMLRTKLLRCRRTEARKWSQRQLAKPHNYKGWTGNPGHPPRLPELRSFAQAPAVRWIDQSG